MFRFIWEWLYSFKPDNDYKVISEARAKREERWSDNPGNFVAHCDYHGYYDIREGCSRCGEEAE